MSDNPAIPEAAVEAAARSLVASFERGYVDADDLTDALIDVSSFDLLSAAREALKAAVVLMQDQARDDMLDEKAREAKEEWADERGSEDVQP